MINQPFDEDVDDDDATIDPVIPEKPIGEYSRVLADREIWFNSPKPGQFSAWQRYRQTLVEKFYKIRKRAGNDPETKDLLELKDVAEKLDLITIELFESLVVRPEDVDFIAMQMIAGKVTVSDLNKVLFGGGDEPEDDEAPKIKKAAAKPRAYKKAAANAKRTKR